MSFDIFIRIISKSGGPIDNVLKFDAGWVPFGMIKFWIKTLMDWGKVSMSISISRMGSNCCSFEGLEKNKDTRKIYTFFINYSVFIKRFLFIWFVI